MIVTFSTFSKKLNSTARSSGGTSYNCALKKGSSKLNPYIELAASNPTAYNYAYIPTYGRYYYVENWTFDGGLWSADLSVDVLASFKDAIGAASLYILRSSAEYDEKIFDSLYPTKLGKTIEIENPATNWAQSYPAGSYVLGVVSKGAANGAVAYHVLGYSEMTAFRNAMMNLVDIPAWDTDWSTVFTEFNGEVAKCLINPFQYVVSCMWLPFSVSAGSGAPLDFGYWTSGVSAGMLAGSVTAGVITCAVPSNFKNTPDEWRRLGATYAFTCEPFGSMVLDPTFMADASNLYANWICDNVTGAATMRIRDDNGHLYGVLSAQLGVSVQLAQMSVDYTGLAKSAIGTVGGTVGSALRGDVAGAITGGATGIIDAAEKSVPIVSTSGSGGGLGAIRAFAHFEVTFPDIVDEDNNLFGRPLCKTRTPAALGGYMVAQSGACIASGATQQEKEQIRSFVEGGFYYE